MSGVAPGRAAAVDGGDPLPDAAWWVALTTLPAIGPKRLRALVPHGPRRAWDAICAGAVADLAGVGESLGPGRDQVVARWAAAARATDVAAVWAAHAGLQVTHLGGPPHPRSLAEDVDAPVVLFGDGDPDALAVPTLAVVGTRRCTPAGAELAVAIGAAAAAAGAAVVSGLATGIDAAAHRGALSAGPDGAAPVAVVGSGLDVVYPPRSAALWAAVAETGIVVSEHPLGTEPARWRFPARNRIVAALADVLVVVESPRRGGSMYTVDEALRRDRTVMAVPGSVRSRASEGTNWLLSQGATVATSPDDVLLALGLAAHPSPRPSRHDERPRPSADGRRVLRALGWDPATLDDLCVRLGWALGRLALAVDELDAAGWVGQVGGRIERRAAP